MSQITDKRALCIGISYALMEAPFDVAEASDFHKQPGTYDWAVDRSTGLVIPDSQYWMAAQSVLDSKTLNRFEVKQHVYPFTPLEALIEDARWASQGKLSHLYISLHGFEVTLVYSNGKKKVIRGLYLGYDPVAKIGYAYSFDYLAKNFLKYFDVIQIDACFAGGAKHPDRYVVPGQVVATDTVYTQEIEPKIKAFTLDPDECNMQWIETEPQDPDKKQTIIVATRQNKPAYGAIHGGPGRMFMYNTGNRSLFTAGLFTISRRHLMSAYGYKGLRKVSAIISDTNQQMNGVKLNWKSLGAPNCSASGPGNRILFEE